MLTTGADDTSFAGDGTIIKVSGYHHRWLAGDYNLEIGLFRGGYHGGYLENIGVLARETSKPKCINHHPHL